MNETLKYIISASVVGFDKAVTTIKNFGKELNTTGQQIDNTTTKSKGLTGALTNLMGRAMLTIPVWMALRAVMMGVIQTFSAGVESIINFDQALVHAKLELLGMKDLDSFMVNLREEAI